MAANNITKLPAKSEALTHDPRKKALLEKRDDFMEAIKYDLDLSHAEARVIALIADYINCDPEDPRMGLAWPSLATIAEETGVCLSKVQRTVKKWDGIWYALDPDPPWKNHDGYAFDPIWSRATEVLRKRDEKRAARKAERRAKMSEAQKEAEAERQHETYCETPHPSKKLAGTEYRGAGTEYSPKQVLSTGTAGTEYSRSLLLTTCTDHSNRLPKVAPKGRDVIVKIDEVRKPLPNPMITTGSEPSAPAATRPRFILTGPLPPEYDEDTPF